MRHPIVISLCVAGFAALSACGDTQSNEEVSRKFQDVNVVDETNLNDVMLTVGDPNEAVNYFQRASAGAPDRIDLMRGLALSLVRAKRADEARVAWARVVDHKDSTNADRVQLADALIRANEWEQAEKVLDAIPPTHETYKRYRLEAMIADGNKEWKKADSFYEVAIGLTTKPASVLNNWGYSKLSRGAFAEAERLFVESIGHDPSLFTTKNNLVLARGAQRKYELPVLSMTQVERAQLLHTLALTAIKQNDISMGKTLLQEAIETHPQYFEAAVRALRALDPEAVN